MAWFISRDKRVGHAAVGLRRLEVLQDVAQLVEQALRLGHVAAAHGLLHLLEHPVEVVLRDHPVGLRAGSGSFSPCCCWRCMRSANSRRNLSMAWRSSSVRRLISSLGGVAVHRLAQALLRGAQLALGLGEIAVLDLERHRPEPVGDLDEILVGPCARRRRSAPARRPMNTPHCGVKRSGAMSSASRATWTRLRSSGSSTSLRRCSTSALASGLVKGRCGRVKSIVSLRPSWPASSLARRRRASPGRRPRDGW